MLRPSFLFSPVILWLSDEDTEGTQPIVAGKSLPRDTQVRLALAFFSALLRVLSVSALSFSFFARTKKLLHRFPKPCTATPVDARLASQHNARNKFEQELVEPSVILAT
jgi:hypothetical protein